MQGGPIEQATCPSSRQHQGWLGFEVSFFRKAFLRDFSLSLSVILQVLSTFVFETGSLAALQFAKQARLSGERATKICLYI